MRKILPLMARGFASMVSKTPRAPSSNDSGELLWSPMAIVKRIVDPLIRFAGRVEVTFEYKASKTTLQDLTSLIDREKQTVRSSDNQCFLTGERQCLKLRPNTRQMASQSSLPASISCGVPEKSVFSKDGLFSKRSTQWRDIGLFY